MADQLGLFGGPRVAVSPTDIVDRGAPTEIPLEDAEPLRLWRRWCADHDALLDHLTRTLPWEQHEMHFGGAPTPMPRLECWLGPERGIPYVYSGERYLSQDIHDHPDLVALRDLVSTETGHVFDSLFANLYRGERDSIGWHADAEVNALGPLPEIVIASLSLGVRRRFEVRHRVSQQVTQLELGQGDLLLMGRRVQSAYEHRAPKSTQPTGPRLNLTFRRLVGRGRAA